MLVLTRKPRQSVVIGKDEKITVTLLEITKHHARIGFSADASVPIMREELLLELPTLEEETQGPVSSSSTLSTQVTAKQQEKNNKQKKNAAENYLH